MTSSSIAQSRPLAHLADYLELTKPRLSLLVLMTTAVGGWLGLSTAHPLSALIPICLGTALVVGGANALNQWLEREPDALMRRTQHRPIPAGRLSPESAYRFGVGLSVVGIIVLAASVNLLSAIVALAGWASYILGYTPMKRHSPFCTLLGAVSGAVPPVIGWAGVRNTLGMEAWALFALLYVWQLPHFLALSVLYRDDYARAGFPMLPLIEPDGRITARQIALYGVTMLPVSLFPAVIGVAGGAYCYGALALSLGFCAVAAHAAWARSLASAERLFLTSVLYLPVLLGWLAWNRAPL